MCQSLHAQCRPKPSVRQFRPLDRDLKSLPLFLILVFSGCSCTVSLCSSELRRIKTSVQLFCPHPIAYFFSVVRRAFENCWGCILLLWLLCLVFLYQDLQPKHGGGLDKPLLLSLLMLRTTPTPSSIVDLKLYSSVMFGQFSRTGKPGVFRAVFSSYTFHWSLPCQLKVWEWGVKCLTFDPSSKLSWWI